MVNKRKGRPAQAGKLSKVVTDKMDENPSAAIGDAVATRST